MDWLLGHWLLIVCSIVGFGLLCFGVGLLMEYRRYVRKLKIGGVEYEVKKVD